MASSSSPKSPTSTVLISSPLMFTNPLLYSSRIFYVINHRISRKFMDDFSSKASGLDLLMRAVELRPISEKGDNRWSVLDQRLFGSVHGGLFCCTRGLGRSRGGC
ncbi:hypothetical protein BT93_B1478 [Corymbia citriodora subsp. variegata]|nr:hypothetical protein BT93_B1478 [Corymbia citriodora subsp. variegata]